MVAVIGLAYLLELWLVQPDWGAVALGIATPRLEPGALAIAMGMLGATVMPHNLYLPAPARTGPGGLTQADMGRRRATAEPPIDL